MTILLVGGGTGGHIIPLLAVAHELKAQNPKLRIVAVIDKSTSFGHLLDDCKDIDAVKRISAGKFRRYPNQTFVQTILDVKTLLLNIRDGFRVMVGFFEALRILVTEKPKRIFIKGGFVAVPVGLAAKLKGMTFITHDSDAEPGLANRIIGRWADMHLVGMPVELYPYPKKQTIQVGIPVGKDFRSVSDKQQAVYKEQIGVKKTERLILVTGGSQGATALNAIIAGAIEDLLKLPDVRVIHQTGKHQTGLPENSDRYTKVEFISTMHIYTGAADIVVTRAGSFMAELAAQGRAAIVVPAPHLAGGHQIKNAKILSERKAAKVLDEGKALRKPQLLSDLIKELLKDTGQARALANNLHTVYPGGAAQKIANYILVDQ
jgi:UDP-N-acetylglucosamine--N-acetylmuramyl-(pentapeptide) pyrophosphoryl-undecaprenol N-acetylglucosamine transferase